jgi:hypothetical protein
MDIATNSIMLLQVENMEHLNAIISTPPKLTFSHFDYQFQHNPNAIMGVFIIGVLKKNDFFIKDHKEQLWIFVYLTLL